MRFQEEISIEGMKGKVLHLQVSLSSGSARSSEYFSDRKVKSEEKGYASLGKFIYFIITIQVSNERNKVL